MSGQQHVPAALYPRERPGTHFTRGSVVPQGRSGWAENLIPTGIRSQTFQPVAQSLYRLSYPAHKYKILSSWNINKSIKWFWFAVTYFGLRWHVLVCGDMFWFGVTCLDLWWHVLICGDVFWFAVTCFDLRWHVLFCGDIFWFAVTCFILLLHFQYERNTLKLHVQIFPRINTWMFETYRRHCNRINILM